MHSAIVKEILNRKFEKTEGGDLYLPGSKVYVGGVFEHWVNEGEHEADGNIVVNEGLDHILDVALSAGAQNANWYIGIYKNVYDATATTTAATIAGSSGEVTATTDVSETVRQPWTDGGVSSRSVTNSASPATYTAAGTIAVNGAFLVSSNTIGGTAGKLMASASFAATRNLSATDVLNVTYTFTIADA